MSNSEVAAWGHPGIQLLPAICTPSLETTKFKPFFQRAFPNLSSFKEFDTYWERHTQPLSKDILKGLSDIAVECMIPNDHVVITAEIERQRILDLPLSVRTLNALSRSTVFATPVDITAGHLLQIPNFGTRSLVELMCVVESSGSEILLALSPHHSTGEPTGFVRVNEARWPRALTSSLEHLFVAARDLLGCDTVADALKHPRLPEIIRQLEFDQDLEKVDISELLPNKPSLGEKLIELVEAGTSKFEDDRLELLLRRRQNRPESFRAMGEELGLTAEATRRQIERIDRAISASVELLPVQIASLIGDDLGAVTTESIVMDELDRLFVDDGSVSKRLACSEVIQALGYRTHGGFWLSAEAEEALESLGEAAPLNIDDVGIIDLDSLLEITEPIVAENLETFAELAGFHKVAGRWATRDTEMVRVKAALIDIGRPATKEEIVKAGHIQGRISSRLSVIESIGRVDKERWGLLEWITDVYEGVAAEIRQRIDEHGGSCPMEFLLSDIPFRFGVSEGSVRAYIASPAFTLQDGMVRNSDGSDFHLRPIDEVADRTENGAIFWDFPMELRYLKGYSLAGVPPELADALDCLPDGNTKARILYPPNCGTVSVRWPLATTTGASIGYLREALSAINAVEGSTVRMRLVKGGGVGFSLVNQSDSPI